LNREADEVKRFERLLTDAYIEKKAGLWQAGLGVLKLNF
jgi:hypothetical protein